MQCLSIAGAEVAFLAIVQHALQAVGELEHAVSLREPHMENAESWSFHMLHGHLPRFCHRKPQMGFSQLGLGIRGQL